MKHPAATQAQRNRRIRSQEAMNRSHRRSELIRLTPIQEEPKLPFSPLADESAARISSPCSNRQGVYLASDGLPKKLFPK